MTDDGGAIHRPPALRGVRQLETGMGLAAVTMVVEDSPRARCHEQEQLLPEMPSPPPRRPPRRQQCRSHEERRLHQWMEGNAMRGTRS